MPRRALIVKYHGCTTSIRRRWCEQFRIAQRVVIGWQLIEEGCTPLGIQVIIGANRASQPHQTAGTPPNAVHQPQRSHSNNEALLAPCYCSAQAIRRLPLWHRSIRTTTASGVMSCGTTVMTLTGTSAGTSSWRPSTIRTSGKLRCEIGLRIFALAGVAAKRWIPRRRYPGYVMNRDIGNAGRMVTWSSAQ